MSMVHHALRRLYTLIVMVVLILLAAPFALRNMATDIFPAADAARASAWWWCWFYWAAVRRARY